MKTEHMWAKCLNSRGIGYDHQLVEGREYHIVKVKVYKRFASTCFYVLENGIAYPDFHFTVTYPLNREIGNDFK